MILSVVKKVEDPQTQVDCVTGATLTSNGVDAMLKDCLNSLKLETVVTDTVGVDSLIVEE